MPLSGPPLGYNFRAEIQPETKDVIGKLYPQLMDLVEEGEGSNMHYGSEQRRRWQAVGATGHSALAAGPG